jgi:glycosyltransferase involved in cell wall biosynthesis
MDTPTIQAYRSQLAADVNVREGGLRFRGGFFNAENPEKPLVSVITVVRNGEATLERTMKSVLAQNYDSIEYIVIDGGSTDRTLSIIERYENQLAYWRSEPDHGVSDAFNKGIALASGSIIALLNSDDWYEPDAVAQSVQNILSNEIDVSHGNLQQWKDDKPDYLLTGNHALLHRFVSVQHPTVFVKSSVYIEHGLYLLDYRCAMDYEWLLRVKLRSARFSYLDSTLTNMQKGGLSDKYWVLSFKEIARAKKNHLGASYRHDLYLVFELAKDVIRRLEEKTGLSPLTWAYRKYFGLAKC